ncbi:glycosyltransferase [Candidatus Parcubacteria bacterium]|nr:MAG: glycosyltransferase [Candidatus Parcubacteria bacterium]
MNKPKVEICIPIYNEERIIEKNLRQVIRYCQNQSEFSWRIVALVNGSNDQSWKICSQLARQYPNILAAYNLTQGGRGNALRWYFGRSQADAVGYMDADLAVSLDCLPALFVPIIKGEADVVLGSRLVVGAHLKRSWLRSFISMAYNLLSRLIIGPSASDLQCGFKAICPRVFKKISPHLRDKKWFFDTELIIFSRRLGLKIKEVPVNWSENRPNQKESRVKIISDSVRFLINLLKLRWRLWRLKI